MVHATPTRGLSVLLEDEHRRIDDDIERVATAAVPTDADLAGLTRAATLLRRHIYAEEERVFPVLRGAGMFGPVLVMLREHAEIWETLDALETAIAAADPDIDAVTLTCRHLLAQLQVHNAKEETILYAQADAVLDADLVAEIRSFLAGGETPAGWTCHQLKV